MTDSYVVSHVWLVLDADRDPIDVFADEAGATESAHLTGGIAERWPISSGPRNKAWSRAFAAGRQMTRNRKETP